MATTKRLMKRTSGKPKETPVVPEPDTSTEKGSVNVAEKTAPMLGKCKKCTTNPSYSESDHFCFNCHMLAQGFEFDAEKNSYILRKRRK
jgi:hypothetical protein